MLSGVTGIATEDQDLEAGVRRSEVLNLVRATIRSPQHDLGDETLQRQNQDKLDLQERRDVLDRWLDSWHGPVQSI